MSNLPLSGITVVFLEQAVAAPFAARQLAEQGAPVIKIERPGAGDFARSYDQAVLGQSGYFLWLNRSKESLSLDVKKQNKNKYLYISPSCSAVRRSHQLVLLNALSKNTQCNE